MEKSKKESKDGASEAEPQIAVHPETKIYPPPPGYDGGLPTGEEVAPLSEQIDLPGRIPQQVDKPEGAAPRADGSKRSSKPAKQK